MGERNGNAGMWARRREARAREALAAELAAWEDRKVYLDQLLAIADGSFAGAAPSSFLGVQVGPGEQRVISLSPVELVEATRTQQSSQGGYVELGITAPVAFKVGTQRGVATAVPDLATTVDCGEATVTNKRVLFRGPRQTRVWDFRDLVSIDMDPAKPIVYFHDRRKQKTGGLRFHPALRGALEDHLELAMALARGEQRAVIARLEELLEEHRRQRPAMPADGRRPVRRPTSAGSHAGLLRRLMARVVDSVVFVVVASTLALPFAEYDAATGETNMSTLVTLVGFAAIAVLEAAFTAATTGTPGKRLARCAVVDVRTGSRPTFWWSLVRSGVFVGAVLTVVGALADAIATLSDEDGRSLHDRASRTIVVRTHPS